MKTIIYKVKTFFTDGEYWEDLYTNVRAAKEDKAFTLKEFPEADVVVESVGLFDKFETSTGGEAK